MIFKSFQTQQRIIPNKLKYSWPNEKETNHNEINNSPIEKPMAVARCLMETIWDKIHLWIVMCGDKGRLFAIDLYNYLIFIYLGSVLLLNFKKMTFIYSFDVLENVEKSVDKSSDLFMITGHNIEKPF